MSPAPQALWTPDEDAELRRLTALGKTARQIGIAMKRSRNSIIGRWTRLKIELPEQTKARAPKAGSAIHRQRLAQSSRKAVRGQQSTPASKRKMKPPKPVAAPVVAAASVPKPLMDYRYRIECAAPLWPDNQKGGPTSLYCCAPVLEGAMYCPEHQARFYTPARRVGENREAGIAHWLTRKERQLA